MEKLIIQRKIQVTMKTFAPPFFNDFNLSLNRKKCDVKRAMRKKLKIFTFQMSIYYILIGNLARCKCEHCKNEAREKDCPCRREVDAKLIALIKTPGRERSISPSSFYGQLPDF